MPLSPEQYLENLVREFGEENNPAFEAMATTWWSMHDDKAQSGGLALQYLNARREGALYKMTANADNFDWEQGTVRQDDSDVVKNWAELLKAIDSQIERVILSLQNFRGYQVGQISRVVGIPNPSAGADANDDGYRGSPYKRTWFSS
jgi:hypothetical protein